jgi:flagellar biosynthetic protein FliR
VTELIAGLSELLGLAQGVAWAAVLAFIRIGAMVSLMPGLGDPAVPPRVKLALVVAFTLVVTPVLADRIGPETLPSFLALGGEVVAGLLLGIGMRLFVVALQTAAAMIAQATTLSQLFAGVAPEPQPAIGNLLVMAGVALAMAAGLHVRATELLLLSYELLPGGGPVSAASAAGWGLAVIGQTFSLAFSLAAPFVIASLIYNLALGVINRAMPALMVSMVGAPALTLGALALMAVATPVILAVWLDAFASHMAEPFAAAP